MTRQRRIVLGAVGVVVGLAFAWVAADTAQVGVAPVAPGVKPVPGAPGSTSPLPAKTSAPDAAGSLTDPAAPRPDPAAQLAALTARARLPRDTDAAPRDTDAPRADRTVWPATVPGIQGAIHEAIPSLQYCYEQWLQSDPQLGGNVDVAFSLVDADGIGRVGDLHVARTTVGHDAFEACVLRQLQSLQFDPPEGGKLDVTYPFVFAAADPG